MNKAEIVLTIGHAGGIEHLMNVDKDEPTPNW